MLPEFVDADLPLGGFAVRTGAECPVHQLMRRMTRHGLEIQQSAHSLPQLGEYLPIMEGALGLVEDCWVVPCRVSDGQIVKPDVVVIVLQRRGRRQNDVGVTRCFVERWIQ